MPNIKKLPRADRARHTDSLPSKPRGVVKLPAAPGAVRIIAGKYRRTPLKVAPVRGLRPTPDRVRETVFNWIAHLCGPLEGKSALDMFAGTGALGFEAASRGARRAVLCEMSPLACGALGAAKEKLKDAASEILPGDVFKTLLRLKADRDLFDLVFIDPPYETRLQGKALESLAGLLSPGALIYLEAPKGEPLPFLEASGFRVEREGFAAGVSFYLLRKDGL